MDLNASLSYIRSIMGENYAKICHFANFLDFENGYCYLNTITCRRRKKLQGFHASFFKNMHHFIDFNVSLSNIRSIMGKIMLKCAIFANILDFENDCCYLHTIA